MYQSQRNHRTCEHHSVCVCVCGGPLCLCIYRCATNDVTADASLETSAGHCVQTHTVHAHYTSFYPSIPPSSAPLSFLTSLWVDGVQEVAVSHSVAAVVFLTTYTVSHGIQNRILCPALSTVFIHCRQGLEKSINRMSEELFN